ncbi:hypothetical protein [Psychrobacter sp. JCM 18900]|uniref:hypothetical protein n=1 Tax=Psychrobacter sp. JCM 18900 TaxID=1298608 RepID=UPI001919F069|nr:hypothetical protein [Psychrobacter sp. JCM 18900]
MLIDQEIDKDVMTKFRKYIYLFDCGRYGSKLERLDDGPHIQLSQLEFTVLAKLRDIQCGLLNNENNEEWAYARLLSKILDNDEFLVESINRNYIMEFDYFFIQAFFHHIQDALLSYVESNNDDRIATEQLRYTARMSISLAEIFSDIRTSYEDIELTKHTQYDQIEELTEGANDFIYSLGELSNLTSKSEYVEALLTKLKDKYLSLDAAEEGFNSLFEYLGYLIYVGNDHFLYEMSIDELQNKIVSELSNLTLPDIVFLLEDDIHSFVDDGDLGFQGWSHLEKFVFSSDEFDRLVRSIKNEFLHMAPE